MWSPHLHCFLQFIPVFICPINSPNLMPSHACLTMALDDIESSFVDSPPSSITFLYVAFVSTASGINQSHRHCPSYQQKLVVHGHNGFKYSSQHRQMTSHIFQMLCIHTGVVVVLVERKPSFITIAGCSFLIHAWFIQAILSLPQLLSLL